MPNQSANHTRLKSEILLALGMMPEILIWNAPTGTFRSMDNASIITKVGIRGMPDLQGVCAPCGRFFGIEVKTGAGVQSEVQKFWEIACLKRGGAYCVARSVEDAKIFISKLIDNAGK